MTLLEQRLHDLNVALAPHDLLVEVPSPDYPYLHLYAKMPILPSQLLMSLLRDEPGGLTADDATNLDHIAKTFLKICALNASADDILDWARATGHIKEMLPAASSGDSDSSRTPSDRERDTPAECCVEPSGDDTQSGQWTGATIWEGILRPCARCERDFREGEYEAQERLEISFRAGYGSIFGDENVVRGTFCQHCVKDVLGSWLEILEDYDHKHRVAHPKAAYQPYQIEPVKPGE